MSTSEETIAALQEAVRLSPENAPLRVHLADTLMSADRPEEAEKHFREALKVNPNDARAKLGLGQAFHQQGKHSYALVVIEELIRQPNTGGKVLVFYGRLLLQSGDVERAVEQYKKGVELSAESADPELASRLGITGRRAASAAASDDSNPEEVVDGKVRAGGDASDDDPSPRFGDDVERPSINFKDVGGMESLKEEIRMKIIHPLANSELFRAYGKPIGGGILLYGPPGCGKTHLARATAGEIDSAFLAIGISDVLDMWIGRSERNLHDVFERARRNKPCVLFFDEVDALAASRADMRNAGGRHVINQFLSDMDGATGNNDGLLILAATNAPWHVDAAFRRPGRFDRILFVPPPDAPARAGIFRVMLRGKPIEQIDYDAIAATTEGFSGADLKAVADKAIDTALRAAMKGGGLKPLTTKGLLTAAKQLKPSTREWFATARNYALYSNEGGAYDDILRYLKL
jgi:transitional endoplasmic reticulum ATPase